MAVFHSGLQEWDDAVHPEPGDQKPHSKMTSACLGCFFSWYARGALVVRSETTTHITLSV